MTKPTIALILLLTTTAGAAPPDAEPAQLTIVTLGDSITKGVRPGVAPDETFAALLEDALEASGLSVKVVNVGIGGERTDQALQRLDAVAGHGPRLVTVMYGTNDSYVDPGKSESRLSLDQYRDNLRRIAAGLLRHGVEPVLMTAPRWAADAGPDGAGGHPNDRLEPYLAAGREVARECRVPLIDHFAHWTAAERDGQNLREWTTDGCHPNPRGHRQIADRMLPVLLDALRSDVPPLAFDVQLETVLKHDDGRFLWFHPRVAALPGFADDARPAVVMALQKHLRTSDHYSGLSTLRTDDLGSTWTGPVAQPALDWVREPDGIDVAVADVTPGWHAPSSKLIAVGAQVRYSPEGRQLEDRPRAHQTAFAVYDPQSEAWSKWERLEMPPEEAFNFARSACAQFVVEPDGTLLLPFYIGASARDPFAVTVVRCAFDGSRLSYVEHGDVLRLEVERGLVEPSLIRFGERYYLTIRNDLKAYVTVSDDGLRYRPLKAWTFDDGSDLGSYNTQQHWLAGPGGLFLAYTRRGAGNDHIVRHRAPLFIGQVDPQRLHVIRGTERILVPERGATLGNFGAAEVSDAESWVTVAEGVWDDAARRRGAEGAVFLARVRWKPNEAGPPPR